MAISKLNLARKFNLNTTDLTNGGAKSSQIKFSKSVTLQTLQAKTTNLEYDKVHFLIESLFLFVLLTWKLVATKILFLAASRS